MHLEGVIDQRRYRTGIVPRLKKEDDVYQKLDYVEHGDLSAGHVVGTDEFYFRMAMYDDVKVTVPPMNRDVMEFTSPKEQARYRSAHLQHQPRVAYLPWREKTPVCGRCVRHDDTVLCVARAKNNDGGDSAPNNASLLRRVIATVPCVGVLVLMPCATPSDFGPFLLDCGWPMSAVMDAPTQRPPIVPKCVFSTAEESVLYALRGRHWEAPPRPHSPFRHPTRAFSDEDPLIFCARNWHRRPTMRRVGARPARAV